jgi:gas vesicle protein
MNRDNAIGFFGIGLLAGAITGGAIALLYAPQSGQATRKQIADKATELGDSFKEKRSEFMDTVREKSNEFVDSVKEAASEANRKGHAAAYAMKN